ncbi:hypothetical protein RRG08_052233 [Elysia crispata]|uniref:Uncharacterized protein n=1 Tax=Elysia crispata TaxID=231223 RepID=A0AAE1BDJ6_9GAST|nr:hypothetical protein RRG08_052233 [Elysia crispata]
MVSLNSLTLVPREKDIPKRQYTELERPFSVVSELSPLALKRKIQGIGYHGRNEPSLRDPLPNVTSLNGTSCYYNSEVREKMNLLDTPGTSCYYNSEVKDKMNLLDTPGTSCYYNSEVKDKMNLLDTPGNLLLL